MTQHALQDLVDLLELLLLWNKAAYIQTSPYPRKASLTVEKVVDVILSRTFWENKMPKNIIIIAISFFLIF